MAWCSICSRDFIPIYTESGTGPLGSPKMGHQLSRNDKNYWLTFGGKTQTLVEGFCDADWASQQHCHSILGFSFPWANSWSPTPEDCTLPHLLQQNLVESSGLWRTQVLDCVSVTWANFVCPVHQSPWSPVDSAGFHWIPPGLSPVESTGLHGLQ